jgi:hypothetical protein
MGISAKPSVIRLLNMKRPGMALPSAIFGIVIVGMITAGAWSVTEVDLKATNNRVDAAAALRLAHTAETHALAVLRHTAMRDTTFNRLLIGIDNIANTDDDGILHGYPVLDASIDIPVTGVVAGGGRYFVTIEDDPRETDGLPFQDANKRLLLKCRGVTASGSSAEINVVVANFFLPALAVDGDMEIASTINTTNTGACGGIHANGSISGGGTTTVASPAAVTATGSISHTVVGTKTPGAPVVDIPDLNPSDFCGFSGARHYGGAGYTWKPGALPLSGHAEPVTYCITGNVEFQADFGSLSVPKNVSVIASGSIKVGGKKVFMKAAHADGIVLMAGGDMDLQGDAGFEGMIYAGGQCLISGKPEIKGQMLCKNKNPHPGADYVQLASGKALQMSGDAKFTFTCNSMLSSVFGVVAWYPTIGS